MDDNIKKLHQALIDDGYDDVGTEQEFRDYVSDSKNVATLYNALSEAGYDNFKDQKSLETYLSSKAPVAQKPSTPQSNGQSVSSQKKEQAEYPQEVLDAFNSPDNKPGNFKDLAQLNDEYQRGVLKKPGIISQALGMMPKVDAGNIGKEQKMGGMIANMLLGDNMQQSQDNNQQVQHPNQENAPATEQPKPTVKDVDAITGAAPVQQVDAIYNKYVGKGDALSETMYDLMASGQAQNQEEAQSMAMGAMNRAANRLAQRTTDEFVSKLGDTVEGVDEAVMNGWHSHAVQDKLKKLASQYGIMNNVAVDENGQYITQTNGYDQFINGMVKPAMVESLVKKYGENYRKTAEDLATRLYSNDEVIQNQLMNQDINEALSDVISKYTSTSVAKAIQDAEAASNAQMAKYNEQSKYVDAASPFAIGAIAEANKTRDPQKILSGLQQKFGKLYRNPEFLNDMSNAAFKVMQRYGMNGTLSGDPKQFKPMINAAIKNELDQLEVKGMIPRGSADYILKTGIENTIIGKVSRKIMQTDYQNWLEDIANQQYQPGFWENVASGALTFAGDAWSYWLPGAAGGKLTKSMVAKAEGKLAGDLMAKGMERKMAERAAKVLIGKSKAAALKSGAAHGAVTFGGQSAISKPIDETYRTGQFDENGKIYNPSVGKVIANTLGEVAKQSAVGAIMQGGTIANMVGKGRGLATNILADIGGKVVDSGIMTGQQLLERMAHDPNFKPTGKDAAETFLESGANLLSIGFPGFVGKYARFKDAREFNKKFDFTDQDIAELKRFGYDGLRDAFEKVGIGEYAVVGENAQRLDGQLTQKYMDLMNDKSVPEVLKAKMMAVVEGKRPSSFSPVIDSEVYRGDDGKYYLETYNKDGGVIDRKEYSSHDAARNDEKKLEYEKTLGLASVLEGEFHNEFTQEHLDGLYNKAAQKYNMGEKLTDEDKAAVYLHQNAGAIKEIMDKQQKGIILTDEEQKQVNAYRHYYDSALENSSVMREFVNTFEDSHGVVRGTLRKALESKDKKYAPLVESYLKELYNSIELKREMKQTMDDLYNTAHGNEQKRIKGENPVSPVEGSAGGQEPPVSVGPAPYQDSTNSVPTPSDAEVAANPANSAAEGAGNEPKVASSDAFVMGQNAYKNGDSEALQAIDYNSDLATGRLKRAFADNEKMPDIVANAYNEGRDMEQFVAQRASSLTPAQKEAISKYVEAMDAKKGAIDALQHADDGYGEALKQQLWPYQTEDGNIVPATLDSGKQVFLKKANEYGGAFVVVPDEQGQPTIKQVSNAEIKEVGTPVSLDEYIESSLAQQKEARAQQFISQFDGSGLKPNDQVTVAMEDGDANVNMTFAGYSKDGKIVLTDGKDYLPLSKEEFAAWRKNALDNTINEHLDAEDVEREQKAASQAEADKKQRYANGIVGLSEGQPDYSSNDTDPNVAAEYLQEQFGEDHGKLLNLVNGSRDDIKTQLANKRKAAIEYQNWLDTNADLDPEKAKKVEDELSLVNEQIADLDARFKNWNTIRNSVMTPDEVKAMKEERKADVEKAGVDESAIVPSDDFHVLVLDDKELKKQYPTMDEATDYITSQRKDLYHTQEDVERKINGVNDMLDQYINGETELDPSQLMELNTSKAQLEALQTNLSVAAKGLKAQANKLSRLYKTEVSKQEMEKLGMTPSEQRKALVADALKKNDMNAIHEIYKDASVDVMDLTPQTLEEAVSESLLPHSLNPESLQYELGKSNFKFGIGKGYDSNKFNYLIAKKGTGMSVNEFAVRVYNDLPVNLLDMGYTDQDVRNALLDMFKSYDSVKEMRNVALMNRIAAAEDELSSEEEYYEAQKEREINERQAEIEKYKSYIHEKELSLPSESELDHIYGLEYDRMMEIEDREREYKQYVKSILPELADYDDRSNEEGYGGGSSLGSDSSRRGVDEGNSQGEEVGNGEASSESEIGEGSDSGRKGRQETGSMEPSEGSAVRGSHLPQEASFGERLKSAIAETETEPTEAQKKAGNYKKGHLSFGGYDYTVETPKGVTRSGKDEQGKPWSVTMHDTYGYILGKIGVDGDHIDMFINDAADLDTFDGNVYVVDQVNPETGEFDEHKVMYGYPSEEAATEAYLANYSKDWKGLGKVTSVPKSTFDKWLESSDRKTKPFAEYAMIQQEEEKKAKQTNEALPFDAPMSMDDLPFHRDVKEVKPENLTEAQKVAYDAVSTMLKKAGIPVKVVSNEDMEKVAEAQDNLAVEMLLNDPRLRFYIKTPEQKEAAKAAYDWAAKNRPDKFKQYAIVNMDNPNQPPQYFEKKDLAEKWRKYYTNAWKIGNYKAFNLNKPFEDQIKDVKGDVPSEFDPYKAESLLNKRIELEKQIKETEDSYNAKKKERADYQNQLMQDYMDQHGLSSENDIPDDVWTDYRDKSFEKYQDTLDDLFHKYVELDNQLKAVAEPGVQYLKGKGVVYGYTDGKEIVLNQEHLNPNTPIHEYQHLWRTAAKNMNPELIEHGDKLIMQTQLFADLKQDPNYNHLTDEQICDEAFARLTGEDGAAILEQMAKDAIKENPLDTAKELSVINKLKEWLKKFWYWTLDTFTKWKPEDIKKMTLEDIRNLVLRDLVNGVDPRTVMNEKKEGVKLSNKEKDDATERIDKRIAELNRQEKEQSLKSENGNLAESHDNGYLPSKDNLDGVQSVAPSSAKIDKKFPTKTFYLGNLANFITSMGKNADITAGNFTKKLFEGMGMTPHGKDTQVSEYFKYQTDDGGKTTVRLSDHSGNALSIIKKGGRADKGYSIVVRVDSSPKTKFKANKYSNVAEYVYENPNADGLKDIARSVFNLIDTGEYLDLAGANEVHVSPRNNDADKTLAGVHNITEEKLRKALKLGGLANPSLAVIDTSKSAHDNFGEISFIAPSALVDKRTGKTAGTWITDAYTQRYPSVEREMSEKGRQKFNDWVDSLEYPAADKAEIKRQTEDALSNNNAPAWELMYLKEKGIDIKEYDSRIDYRWKEIIRDHPTAEDILSNMQNDPELNEKVTSLAKHAIIHPTWEKVSLEVRRKMYEETGVKASPINPQVRKQTKEIFERDYKPTLLDKDGNPKADDVKKVVEDIVKEHNDTKKYDFYLSKVKASNYVNKNGLYDDYIKWQENKLDEFGTKNRIFRGYKNDGSRKYVPETLENVSKAMREDADGQTNGSEYTSFGSFIAKLASRVDSTSEMRANKDKLSSNEDKEKFYEKWESMYYDLAKSLYNDVFYGEQRLHDIVSQPDPKKYAKKEYGITLTPSFMKKLDSLKNAVQNELKSAYFETKFNRPVHLNEFVAAVVPNDLGEDVRKGLEESGLSLFDYDPEKEGDRSRAFNEAINSNHEIRFHRVTEVKSPIMEQKLQKHPDSLMKAGTYFSGGGLVEEGLKGIIDPVVAVEYDRKISGVYRNNFGQHIVTADVRDVDPKELVKHIDGEVEYFHASPVCKNYSQAKSNGGEVELDKETAKSTADFIDSVKPRVVTIENVKGYKDSEAMNIITKALDKNGYTWDSDVYNAADYGGYTSRERLIIRAVKDGELPEKPKKQPRKGGWLEAVEDILPTLTVKESGVAPWMDARLKVDGIDWKKVEKPLYVMGSAYADGKIPHAYGDEILPTLRTKSGDVIIMPGGKVLRADGRVLARITGLGDDYLLPKTESLAHTIIGNGIPVQLTKSVIAPLLNKDDLSGRNVLARLGSSIFKNNWDADKQKQVSDRVVNTANKLGGAEATVYTSVDEVPDAYLSDVKNGATGWYDPTTHTVHVYLPNCADANEAERTVLHEKIGHEGMEVLLGGEDGVRKFANFVYNSVAASTRGKILEITNKYDPDWKNPDRMNVGTQEYIAHLAEEGPKTAEDFTLWTKIKHYLIRLLKKLGIRVPGLLNDKDLRYYLMKAGKALHVWDEMPREKQEAMMKQASNAEIKDALSDGAGKGKPRQKKGESQIAYIKRRKEWEKWKIAREDTEDPEPPMFYDFDKDAEGKKEWERLNKEWRDDHHLQGDEMPIKPERKEGETDEEFFPRYKEWEKWNDAMGDKENPMPDMFSFEKQKQDEARANYEKWLTRHELNEQNNADLDLYEGKIYPAETNPEADALEQRVMQDLAEVTSTDVSKEGAARSVHDAVIYRRKNIESASANDAIFINSVKQELNKMANASYLGRKADAIADVVKETVTGKTPKTQAKKMAEAIPYIIEAPRRMRDIADEMNAVGAFENGHIHVTANDIDAIQPFTEELRNLASKNHKVVKDGKETIVYDDVPSMAEVASKMAKEINDNHVGEEGFVPVDGTDILAEHVLPVVLKRIVPQGIEYKNLSEEMQSLLDKIREWYDKTFTWLKDSHTVREDIGYTADYVNHRWDKEKSDDKAYADLVEGRQRTKSPNEKPRKVSTYMEGVDTGLVPKTTDISELLAYYSQSNIEAFANKTFLQELSGINVIERNKDGEITSRMPLLSSIQPKEMMVDENKYTPYVVPGINTVWVYNQGKIFNKSAEDWFNAAFGTVKLPKVLKGVKNAMSIAKTLELGFSGFHAGALTEVYAVQNSAEFGPAKAMAYFMKYLITDTAKNHQLPAFANPDVFKEAAKHLVKFGSASDYATADIENLYEKVHSYVARLHSKLVEGNVAMKAGSSVTFPLEVATELLKMSQKGLDVALWSYLHDGLKLATYQLRAERTRERAKKLDWNEDMLNKALDEDGQFVNDMFGGQHFDVLGISKKMQTILDFIFLSKDWLISTTRHALSIFGYGSIWNEASIKNFWEYYKHVLGKGEMTKGDYLRLSRSKSGLLCYGVGFMIGYEGLSQLVNAAMRAWDEEKQKEKADEIRKTNPSYKSPYELAYPDGMHWYDYLMRGNSLGQQSKIFMGRYADGTEMYIRHGKQFREIPELFFDAKDNFAIPGPMVRRMYGKSSPLLRGMIDTYKWYLSPDYADKEMQRKYGENLGLIPKLASYYVPFAVPTQKDKEFKMLDLVFPSSKGFSRYKAQDYFKTFIMSEDKQGLAMTYNACVQNGIDPEEQLKAAISSVKALEASEMSDGVTSLQEASKRFDAAKSITEKKKMRQKMKKFLSQSDYKAFTQKEALDMVQGYLNGDEDLKEMEKAESKYLMKANAEDVTEDWRIQNVWNGTMDTYQEFQRLKDVDKAKANAFKNSKTNKRLFAARKAISTAKKKMDKAKKQMDGQNDAAKMVEIRKTRKELIETLNGME